jgi:hypothetical protein
VRDQEKSKNFYVHILGGKVIRLKKSRFIGDTVFGVTSDTAADEFTYPERHPL